MATAVSRIDHNAAIKDLGGYHSLGRLSLEKKLGEPLNLELGTEPFLPPVVFGKDGEPDEASRTALAKLKQFDENGLEPHIVISAPRSTRGNDYLMRRDIANLKSYLVNELGIPPATINRGPNNGSCVCGLHRPRSPKAVSNTKFPLAVLVRPPVPPGY